MCIVIHTPLFISKTSHSYIYRLSLYIYSLCVVFLVAQSCLTLCYPMDCSLPGSSVHGILQARILEWLPSSRGSSQPRDRTQVSCIAGGLYCLSHQGSPYIVYVYSQSYGFSSGHVWVWELDHKEGWVRKNWCSWIVVLEKTLESPLDCKEIKPVNPKGNRSWIYIGRTDAEAEAPILWPPDAKNWLTRKHSDSEKDWRQEEKGMPKDETVGWHHQLNGHEFDQGDGKGQGSPACYSP